MSKQDADAIRQMMEALDTLVQPYQHRTITSGDALRAVLRQKRDAFNRLQDQHAHDNAARAQLLGTSDLDEETRMRPVTISEPYPYVQEHLPPPGPEPTLYYPNAVDIGEISHKLTKEEP